MSEKTNGYWNVADSYVRQNNEGKITSLTICYPKKEDEDCIQLTFSIKDVEMIRVKLGVSEIAGLSDALNTNKEWKATHTFEKDGAKTTTYINYQNYFINVARGNSKIALKLTDNERMSMALTLRCLHFQIIERRCRKKD